MGQVAGEVVGAKLVGRIEPLLLEVSGPAFQLRPVLLDVFRVAVELARSRPR